MILLIKLNDSDASLDHNLYGLNEIFLLIPGFLTENTTAFNAAGSVAGVMPKLAGQGSALHAR